MRFATISSNIVSSQEHIIWLPYCHTLKYHPQPHKLLQANGAVFVLTQSTPPPPPPPLVSVIMPAFNTEAWIGEAIDSLLQQTFEDFECIIVDDGSTDNTAQVVRRFSDPRIAMSIAKGKYLARMDSDDICVPQRFQLQIEFMENNPNIGISGGYHSIFGHRVPKRKHVTRYFPLSPADIQDWMLLGKDVFSHPTVIIRKSIFLAGYRYEGGNGGEDGRLWHRAFFGKSGWPTFRMCWFIIGNTPAIPVLKGTLITRQPLNGILNHKSHSGGHCSGKAVSRGVRNTIAPSVLFRQTMGLFWQT